MRPVRHSLLGYVGGLSDTRLRAELGDKPVHRVHREMQYIQKIDKCNENLGLRYRRFGETHHLMSFADRIKSERKALGLTQAEFAEFVVSTQSTVSGWESGKSRPTTAVLKEIADKLGVNVGWLLTGEGDRPGTTDASLTNRLQTDPSVSNNGTVERPFRNTQQVKVVMAGPVQGGVLQDVSLTEPDDAHEITMPAPVKLWGKWLEYKYRYVIGDSVNNYVGDGGAVVTVPLEDFTGPLDNQYVVVERHEAGRVERLVKLYKRTPEGVVELWGNSKNPRWNGPIPLSNGGEDAEVRVIEVCVGRMLGPSEEDS